MWESVNISADTIGTAYPPTWKVTTITTRTFSIIVSNSGFDEAVDDDGSYCYKTPVQRGSVYDAIIPVGTWPWERIIFRHLEGMYLSETTLRNISYD